MMESSKRFEFCQRPKWTKVLIAWFSVVCLVVFSHITSTISFPTSRDDRNFDPYQHFQAPQNGTVLRLNTRLLGFGWETTLSNPTPLHHFHFHFGDITPHPPVHLPILTSGCDWKDRKTWCLGVAGELYGSATRRKPPVFKMVGCLALWMLNDRIPFCWNASSHIGFRKNS